MARAEPAFIFTFDFAGLLTKRHTTEMRANPDDDQQFSFLNTRLILLNEPYNPAGTLMSRAAQAELVALADAHGIYLLCDEVYRLLEHDPRDRLPAMADVRTPPNVLPPWPSGRSWNAV